MDNLFTANAEENVVTTVTDVAPKKSDKIKVMKDALRQTIASDPDFVNKVRTLSDSLVVVNSLGFGEGGNIVVDKEKSTKEKREFINTSAVVGYRIKNEGNTPIKYQTEVWAADETGKYVATKTEKVLAPGATCELSRPYMTMLCCQPEISFILKNGKIIRGSGSKGDRDAKTELSAYYFSFTEEADGTRKQINADDVKLNVGEKIGDKWVVKPEFVDTFGYLNNAKTTGKGIRKTAGSDKLTSAQVIAANYINQIIQSEGL